MLYLYPSIAYLFQKLLYLHPLIASLSEKLYPLALLLPLIPSRSAGNLRQLINDTNEATIIKKATLFDCKRDGTASVQPFLPRVSQELLLRSYDFFGVSAERVLFQELVVQFQERVAPGKFAEIELRLLWEACYNQSGCDSFHATQLTRFAIVYRVCGDQKWQKTRVRGPHSVERSIVQACPAAIHHGTAIVLDDVSIRWADTLGNDILGSNTYQKWSEYHAIIRYGVPFDRLEWGPNQETEFLASISSPIHVSWASYRNTSSDRSVRGPT